MSVDDARVVLDFAVRRPVGRALANLVESMHGAAPGPSVAAISGDAGQAGFLATLVKHYRAVSPEAVSFEAQFVPAEHVVGIADRLRAVADRLERLPHDDAVRLRVQTAHALSLTGALGDAESDVVEELRRLAWILGECIRSAS